MNQVRTCVGAGGCEHAIPPPGPRPSHTRALQDGYFEEALKWPNVAVEFVPSGRLQRPVALVGAREHVFTSGLSTTAQLMAYQELQFGVVMSRLMYSPLRCRLHYGHPDFCDKLFFQSRGGFAKASKVRR